MASYVSVVQGLMAVVLIALTSCYAMTFQATYQPPNSPRATYNFNSCWKFIRRDVPDAVRVSANGA